MVVLGFPVVDIMKVIGKMHRVHMENLELTQLRLVEAIAETGNLSSAAEVVGLSQSAASHSLARLRKETGDPLFVRTSQRMQPTPYGEQLCAAVHNALLLLREGLRGGRSFVTADASRIFSLYMSEAGQLTMLPQLLAYLREQAPGVRIHVSRLPEKNQGSALEVGQVDMAVGHITTMTTGFHQRLLFHERYVCVASLDNELFAQGMSFEAYKQSPHAIADSSAHIHGKKFALYGDPDQLIGYVSFLLEMGAVPYHILCSKGSKKVEKELQALLDSSPFGAKGKIYMGKDLWHMRSLLMTDPVDAIIGDTHGKFIARDAKIPLFRFGFPVFDRVNKHRYPIIGYQGVINMVTEICNKFIDITDETCEDRQFEMMR